MLAAQAPGAKVDVLPDERPPFERLNRMSLYYLLWANGIRDVTDSMPKEKLVKIAEVNSDDLLVHNGQGQYGYRNVSAYQDGFGSIQVRRPKEHIAMFMEIEEEEKVKKAAKNTKKGAKVDDVADDKTEDNKTE